MILSFAWTTEVLLAGKKTCTRRIWSERTAGSWIKACQSGRWVHQAWNNVPFVKGASKVADIRLTHLPYQQRLVDMSLSDLEAEGGLWASKEEFISLFGGRPERERIHTGSTPPETCAQIVWVVRFELFRVTGKSEMICNDCVKEEVGGKVKGYKEPLLRYHSRRGSRGIPPCALL